MTSKFQSAKHTAALPNIVDLQISDFLVKSISNGSKSVSELNSFFNSNQIKSELHWFTHRDTLERAASRPDRRLFYCAPQDVIIGGLMIWCESRVLEPMEAQIRLVAVSPNHRGYGIGRYLLNEAIEFASKQKKELMIADVAAEAPAVKFWEATGFYKDDSYFTDGGREMYQMKKDLTE